MPESLMILPSRDCLNMRLVRIPNQFEEHEAFRHVTGLIASIEENNPDYSWEDSAAVLEDRGFESVPLVLGTVLD